MTVAEVVDGARTPWVQPPLRIGMRVPHGVFGGGTSRLAEFLSRAEELGLDQICVGDHVSFRDGTGYDGLVQATAVAALTQQVTVQTAAYLLPLRHPVAVARQISSLVELAPGRFVFGVGIGGEDRREMENCGVDPATRGRRMNESLAILQALLAGEEVTYAGRYFQVPGARIRPVPTAPVPVLVAGRSSSAVFRAARFSQGWLGVWVSPERFAKVTAEVETHAIGLSRAQVNWHHTMMVWCGLDSSASRARAHLAMAMEDLYAVPFEAFARYCPCGSPEEVAEFLFRYTRVGCRSINIIAASSSPETALEAVGAAAQILRLKDAVTAAASPVKESAPR
jgi:alkanesulfonate monooxygenase SsuD/methylene tetrahydromethanopterin reductase-like flavin-dependent oxidoreductase (luciferase family)